MAALPTSPFEPTGDETENGVARLRRTLHRTASAAGFWLAVMLPFLYVPLLATGIATAAERRALLLLVGLNGLSLYLGRGHRASGA